MKNLMLIAVFIVFGMSSCSDNSDEFVKITQNTDVVESSVRTSGAGCAVVCFWGACEASCGSGETASCNCDWGSPVCGCSGGASSSLSGYDAAKIQAFIAFVSSNNFSPNVIDVISNLAEVIENQKWNKYENAKNQYSYVLSSLPQNQQQMLQAYMSNNQ